MNRPLRVLHLTFNMGIGGTEQVIRQLVTGLDPDQVTTEILCIDGQVGSIGEQLRASGIPVTSVARRPGFDRALIRNLRRHVREGGFDIVHCHQYTPWVYGWFAALGTPAKVVFTEHGRFHPDRYRYKAALINLVMARTTSAIIAISAATRLALARYEFMPRSSIRVIYNGIAPLQPELEAMHQLRMELDLPDTAFIVGTVSRLDPIKNQSMMLRAFARFLGDCPNAWLLVVGDGPEREHLNVLASQLNISHRVSFTGFIDNPVNHLALMDLFLLSSHSEGTSMTLLEAMSLGIPALVTSVGGNPEIVREGVNGLLTPPDDARAFARGMTELWQNPKRRKQLGQGGQRQFRERFSRQAMVTAYQALYRDCMKGEA